MPSYFLNGVGLRRVPICSMVEAANEEDARAMLLRPDKKFGRIDAVESLTITDVTQREEEWRKEWAAEEEDKPNADEGLERLVDDL